MSGVLSGLVFTALDSWLLCVFSKRQIQFREMGRAGASGTRGEWVESCHDVFLTAPELLGVVNKREIQLDKINV